MRTESGTQDGGERKQESRIQNSKFQKPNSKRAPNLKEEKFKATNPASGCCILKLEF
jgi:hypothetical protein